MRYFLLFLLVSSMVPLHTQKIFRAGTLFYQDGTEQTGLIFFNNVLRYEDHVFFKATKTAGQQSIELERIDGFSIGTTERYVVRTVSEKLQDENDRYYYRTQQRVLRHLEAGPLNLYQLRSPLQDWLYLERADGSSGLIRLEVVESTLDAERKIVARDTVGLERLSEGGMYLISRHHQAMLRRLTADCPIPHKDVPLKIGPVRAVVDRYNRCREGRNYTRQQYFRDGIDLYVVGAYVNAKQYFSEENRRDGTFEFGAEISFPTVQNNFSVSFGLQPTLTWDRETIASRFRRSASARRWDTRTSWVRLNYYFLNERRYQPYVSVGFVNRVLRQDGVLQDVDIAGGMLAVGLRANLQDRAYPHVEIRAPNAPAVRLGMAFRLF